MGCGAARSAKSDASGTGDENQADEHGDSERDSDPRRQWQKVLQALGSGRFVVGRQVADEQVELVVGRGRECGLESLLELVGRHASLARGVPYASGGSLTVGV
jgi:hypothetical protein